jgi:Protein of unknown function (DUF2934)
MEMDREESLRRKAYEKWEAEGRPDGEHHRHWREAESEFSTVEGEELRVGSEADQGEPSPSNDLPKVGEFSSGNK